MKFSSPAPYPRKEGVEEKKRPTTKEEEEQVKDTFRKMEPDECWNSSNSDTPDAPDKKIQKTG